jgi:hypothetical protein
LNEGPQAIPWDLASYSQASHLHFEISVLQLGAAKHVYDTSWFLEDLGSLYDCDEEISEGIYVFRPPMEGAVKLWLNAMIDIFNNFWIRQITACRRGYKLACCGGRIQIFD